MAKLLLIQGFVWLLRNAYICHVEYVTRALKLAKETFNQQRFATSGDIIPVVQAKKHNRISALMLKSKHKV